MSPEQALADAGYRKVQSIKNDPRYVPYWQRWIGPRDAYDWFEFPHDLPIDLVWDVIRSERDAPLLERVHTA